MAMSPNYLRGISGNEFQSFDRSERVMPLGDKIARWLKVKSNMLKVIFAMFVITTIFGYITGLGFIPLIVTFFIYQWGISQEEYAPLKMPILDNEIDYKEFSNNDKPTIGKGVFYIGVEDVTKKEIWITDDDCRQHFMVYGTTGAGKSEMLFGFCANFISWGSGFIFIDGKGDIKGMASIYALAKRWGREADFRVMNFMPATYLAPGEIASNSYNPYTTAPAGDMVTSIVGLMAVGKEDVWSQRARQMIKAEIYVMAWARDNGKLDMNASSITRFMELNEMLTFLTDERFADMPLYLEEQLLGYLCSLPNFQRSDWTHKDRSQRGKNAEGKPVEISDKAYEQHTYLVMQLSGPMGLLTGDFRHIFMAEYGDIDFFDCLFNRRILVVLLPSLNVEAEQTAQMGRINIGGMKSMMGACLGSLGQHVGSTIKDVVYLRPTNYPAAFGIIMDEVGSYLVSGIAQMATQVRSLGISMVFASQDEKQLKKFDEKEAETIIANTNTQIYMRLQDELAIKRAISTGGQEYRARTTELSRDKMAMRHDTFIDSDRIVMSKEDRVNSLDLRKQRTGQFHLFHADWILHGKAFYVDAFGNYKDDGNVSVSPVQLLTIKCPDIDIVSSEENVPKIVSKLVNFEETCDKISDIIDESCFNNLPPEMDMAFSIINGDTEIVGDARFDHVKTPFAAMFAMGMASDAEVENFFDIIKSETEEAAAQNKESLDKEKQLKMFSSYNDALLNPPEIEKADVIGVEVNNGGVKTIEPQDALGEGIVHLGEKSEVSFGEVGYPGDVDDDLFAPPPEDMSNFVEDNWDIADEAIAEVSQNVLGDGGLVSPVNPSDLSDDEIEFEQNSDKSYNPIEQETGSSRALTADKDLPPVDSYSRQSRKLTKAVVSGSVDDNNIRNNENYAIVDAINKRIESNNKIEDYFRKDQMSFETVDENHEKTIKAHDDLFPNDESDEDDDEGEDSGFSGINVVSESEGLNKGGVGVSLSLDGRDNELGDGDMYSSDEDIEKRLGKVTNNDF